MKLQSLTKAIVFATGGLFFSYSVAVSGSTPSQAQPTGIAPSQEQALVSRQLATLVDRQHYLPMRLDNQTSEKIFDRYINSLDVDHDLFLQSEIDQLKQQYASNFGRDLKTGNLEPAFTIHSMYRERLKAYYDFMLAELKKPQNLYQTGQKINFDREKAPFFTTQQQQHEYWKKVLVSQLISSTISKEEEAAKQKALKENPALARGQNLAPPEDLTPVQTLEKRYKRRLERLSRLKSDDILDKTLNAMLATYDPHSSYFPPIDAAEMNRQSSLQLEGIGVSIRPDRSNEDYTKIETIVEGGPASKTGQVRTGDRIIGVAQDGEAMQDVTGWTTQEIVAVVRGKRGTKVTVKLLGQGATQPRLVTITRDIIKEEDSGVRHRVVDIDYQGKKVKVGVIEVPSFYLNYRARNQGEDYRSVSEDTAKAFNALKAQNVAGILVDLRNNPGGNLEEVNKMLGQIIKQGPVIQIRDGNGDVRVFEDQDGGKQLYTGPLAVMINLGSASASEIYSATVQDYERGLVIGSTTTGKGTAQIQLDSLAHGQATLTQRKFYRITGGSTQNKGVIPDIKMVDIYYDQFGERKYDNPLIWDTISTAPFKREDQIKPYIAELQKRSDERRTKDPQFKYLNNYVTQAKKIADDKTALLDLNERKTETLRLEQQTLENENQRRKATGLVPFANWQTYQASMDARNEERAKMKEAQRPPLPEEEAFVIEAAKVLLDWIALKATTPTKIEK